MTPQELQKLLQRKTLELEKLRAKAPDIMGTIGVQVFRRNFRVSGYIQNGAIARWPARAPGTPRNSGRAILISSGTLRDSIRKLRTGSDFVVVGVNAAQVPYAQVHQDGGQIAITPKMRKFFWAMHYKYAGSGRSRGRSRGGGEADLFKRLALARGPIKIPRRRFIGLTPDLEKSILRDLTFRVKAIVEKP